MLKANSIQVSYGNRTVLKDVIFELKTGEFVGLIGANGAGKSTLLNTLAGLIMPAAGIVTLNNRNILAVSQREKAQQLAFLSQQREVNWRLNVYEIVALGRMPFQRFYSNISTADKNNIMHAIKSCDIEHLISRYADTLSGGEQARVLMARALATNSPLLLADEPVTGIDPSHQLELMSVLQQRAKDGNGILVVMHDLHLAARFCDRLVLLHDGNILAEGHWQNVLTEKHLAPSMNIKLFMHEHEALPVVVPISTIETEK